MNKIISIKQKFLCKDREYILEISRLKVKKVLAKLEKEPEKQIESHQFKEESERRKSF